jgi:hypothetical protein
MREIKVSFRAGENTIRKVCDVRKNTNFAVRKKRKLFRKRCFLSLLRIHNRTDVKNGDKGVL